MKTLESYIDIKNIDKSDWKVYKFEKIAKSIGERVEPTNTELEIYVGLEHLDSDSIHIRRYGKKDDVSGTKLRCYPGDVIFGRRRAYQRKAAIVEFDGFCSAHSLVLRANPDIIDPRLFPFFLHSDTFMHRAIDISVGSLSPTINWGTLKNEEFLLPPKDQQACLAELLWAADDVVQRKIETNIKFKVFFDTYLNKAVLGKDTKGNTFKFGDLGETYGGLTGKSKEDFGIGSPYLTYMSVFSDSRIDVNKADYVKINSGENQNEIKFGDIFFTGSSETPEEVGMSSVLLDDVKGYYLNSFCFGFRLHNFKTLLPAFARYLLRGKVVRDFMFKHAQGSTRFNLSKTTVKEKLFLDLPSLKEQNEIVINLNRVETISFELRNSLNQAQQLQKSLINQIF